MQVKLFKILSKTLLLLATFAACSAQALDKMRHSQPTFKAVQRYNQCIVARYDEDSPFYIDAEMANELIEGVVAIDKTSFNRAWNWHFYDACVADEASEACTIRKQEYGEEDSKIKRGFLWMNRSLHKDFARRLEKFQRVEVVDRESFREALKLAAPLMHYIQDMGVPAHVTPTYHVTWNPDNFDSYVPTISAPSFPVLTVQRCAGLAKRDNSPELLLTELANNTLQSLQEPVEKTKTSLFRRAPEVEEKDTWETFWSVKKSQREVDGEVKIKQGFTDYGACGPNFGVGGFSTKQGMIDEVEPTGDEEKCQLPVEKFDDYYSKRYEAIVQSSLRLLLYTSKQFEFNKQVEE